MVVAWINNIVCLMIVNTGSCQMLMCTKIAKALNLPVWVAQNGNFGCYMDPSMT